MPDLQEKGFSIGRVHIPMKKVVAEFHFEMPGLGLWADGELLGEEWQGTFAGHSIKLAFPKDEDDFGLKDEDISYLRALTGSSSVGPEAAAYGVRVIRVAVTGEADFDISDFENDPKPIDEAFEVNRRLEKVATAFIQGFCDQVRVLHSQHWLGSSADPPFRTWVSNLRDQGGTRIPVSTGVDMTITALGQETALQMMDFNEAAENAAAELGTPLPEELLADAKYLAWIRQPHDLRLGVLLAAIACETKVKRTLLDITSDAQRALAEIILQNPRDVSVAVVSHLNQTAQAVTGRSLKTDDPDLWKAVTALFETRNAIAHGRDPQPGDKQMSDGIRTADKVITWLNEL
jgi:hypothetical protein